MIKVLALDVDGTLTDGKIYIGQQGEMFKAFDIKDGCGIHDILPAVPVDWSHYNAIYPNEKNIGIVPVVITARESKFVEYRCQELGIVYCFQKCRNKVEKIKEIAELFCLQVKEGEKIQYPEIAYMGDDILDLPAIEICGKTGCPGDAALKVRQKVDYVARAEGGNGAVREFIEWIIEAEDK